MQIFSSENKIQPIEGNQTSAFSYTQPNQDNLATSSTYQTYYNPQYNQSYDKPLDEIKEFRIWSIINIFLFPIVGIVCFIYSLKTRELKRQGNIEQAKVCSRKLFVLNLAFSITGVILLSFVGLALMAYFIAGSSSGSSSYYRRRRTRYRG
jgi:hypothetical protein